MKPQARHIISALAIMATGSLAGCSDNNDIPPPATSLQGDTGLFDLDIDLPADGEPAIPLSTGMCIQFPDPGAFGYWHQCQGSIELAFLAQYDNKQYTGGDTITFGPGQQNPDYWIEPDSYALPLVAACCGPFDYDNPTSSEKLPYVNSCLFDAVQQVCVGLPYFLRKQARETSLGDGKLALEWLADKVEANTADCLWGLWADGPPGPNGSGVNELWGTSWSIPGANATIELTRSEITDWTQAGEVPELTPCHSFYDNDPAIIPTAPFEVPGVVGGSTIYPLVPGATAAGSGPLSSSASFTLSAPRSEVTFAHDASGAPLVTGIHLEAEPTSAMIAGEPYELAHLRLVLDDPLRPSSLAGEHIVSAGAVTFTAAIGLEGDSRIITMTHADPLVFRAVGEGWQFDPFELTYDEAGIGLWSLTVDGLDLGGS